MESQVKRSWKVESQERSKKLTHIDWGGGGGGGNSYVCSVTIKDVDLQFISKFWSTEKEVVNR